MHSILRRLHTLLKKPLFIKIWCLPVWLLLGISRLVILTVTFRRLAPYLGHAVGRQAYSHLLTPEQHRRAIQVSRVIRLASRYCPWVANCFPQAVTARLLLGVYRIPYALYFGLAKDAETGEFKAHAWVVAGYVPVTGGNSFTEYTTVGCYLDEIHSETA